MTPDSVAVSAMYAAWAQAGVSLLTLFIAVAAAFSWYETLRSQRSDETLGAAIYFQSCVGRFLSLVAGRSSSSAAYDEAWNAQAKLNQALAIQKRYNDFPGIDIARTTYELMNNKIAAVYIAGSVLPHESQSLNIECETIVDRIRGQLTPGIIMRILARARANFKR